MLRGSRSGKRVVEGEFRPGATGSEWCDAEVLRRLRAALAGRRAPGGRTGQHRDARPLPPELAARRAAPARHRRRGDGGEQLAGVPVPASALESLILPSRVADYSPAMLDELTSTGEVLWSGAGSISGKDGWVCLHPADTAPLTLTAPAESDLSDVQQPQILDTLSGGGAYFFRQLADTLGDVRRHRAGHRIVGSGVARATSATTRSPRCAPCCRTRPGPPRATARRDGRRAPAPYRSLAVPTRTAPPTVGGRWSILPAAEPDATLRASATAELLLERYGVVTRGSVMTENVPGGFALMYKVLGTFEDNGRCRRGHFVESLGGAQFSTPPVVDRLRELRRLARGPAHHAARRDARRQRPRQPVRRGPPLAETRRRRTRAPARTQGRRPGGARRRRTDPVRRTRRANDPHVHRRPRCAPHRGVALAGVVKRGGIDKIVSRRSTATPSTAATSRRS